MGIQLDKVRNIALLAHSGAGKTSLAEAMLFASGRTSRLGRVDDGTSILDYEPEEIKRKITINSAFNHYTWQKHTIHFIDTPGDDNFLNDTRMSLQVADSAVFVIDAIDGAKPLTLKIWNLAGEFHLPRIIFINKMDRERADFYRTLDSISTTLNARCVPVQLPIGAEDKFTGVVDLINEKAFVFAGDQSGQYKECPIPDDMKDSVKKHRENLQEYAAEADDALVEKFLEEGTLTVAEIEKGLAGGMIAGRFVLVCCGSATRNIGVTTLMEAVNQYLPSPLDKEAKTALNAKTKEPVEIAPAPDAPLSALVFKTLSDPYAGRLSILRIYSGTLKPDTTLYNTNKQTTERIGQLLSLEGKAQKSVEGVGPGELIAVAKLKDTVTGDTLCTEGSPVIIEALQPPQPVISYALKPKTKADEEKISAALGKLKEEDNAILVTRNEATRETILSGMGQIHIEVVAEKLKRKYNVDVNLTLPKVPYKEAIKKTKQGVVYRHKKQTGGAGQFAEVHFDISPLPQGGSFEFENALTGMNVPRNFVPAVEKGIQEAMQAGPLAGYPVVGVKVRFYDGKSHEVDSSETAFKIAAIQCFKKGMLEAMPILLEPIMSMTILVPDDCMGDVIGDINSRRGKVIGVETRSGVQAILAHVPMVEVLRYASELTSMTAGRGTFSMEFLRYEEVPAHLTEKIVTAAKKEGEA
ncbi:MAG: elongation factor G [Thermodesulfobacteriota bacterium]